MKTKEDQDDASWLALMDYDLIALLPSIDRIPANGFKTSSMVSLW